MQVKTDDPEVIERVPVLNVCKAEVCAAPGFRGGAAAHAGGPHHPAR
jgi:hypothetical protein